MKSIAVAATMISPPGAMGGNTKILLEFARSWVERGVDVCVFTTPGGERTFRDYGVDGVRFRMVSDVDFWQAGFLSTHNRLWRESRSVPLGGERFDVVYSASDFMSDVVLGKRLRAEGLASRWIGSVYLFVPHPAFGYEGHYERRLFGSIDLRLAVFYPYQRLVVLPAVLGADGNMITNEVDAEEFERHGYPRERLHAVYGVVNFHHIENGFVAKRYDAVFVGRLHPQKGLERLLRIWRRVLSRRPGSTLAVVGVGEPEYERRLRRTAQRLGIGGSLSWMGFLEGPSKFDILRRSRVFLHTSVYDNSGMAAAEALACGLPAVMFDLPPLRVTYPNGALKAPIGDEDAFALHVLRILSDKALQRSLGEAGLTEAGGWERASRAGQAAAFIEKILAMPPLADVRERVGGRR